MLCTVNHDGNGAREMTTNKQERLSASNEHTTEFKSQRNRTNLPPDPDGYFAKLARRATTVLAFYERLGPDFEREELGV